jgi:predicted membrane metal-binding protein
LAALLVGERSELPDELERALLRAGVFHIVALSGLNVGLIAMLAAGIFRLLPLSGSWRWSTGSSLARAVRSAAPL